MEIVSSSSLVNRRRFMIDCTLGFAGLGGATLAGFGTQQVSLAADGSTVKRYIQKPYTKTTYPIVMLFLQGGASQLDTFDPKPNAPDGIRSIYNAIQTSQPGVQVTELFPETAQIMDRVALFRNVGYSYNRPDVVFHNDAASAMFTGNPKQENNGKRREYHIPVAESPLVNWANSADSGNGIGYTILHYSQDSTGHNDGAWGAHRPDLGTVVKSDFSKSYPSPFPEPVYMDQNRMAGMMRLRAAAGKNITGRTADLWDANYARAQLLLNGDLNKAFDITKEPDHVRDLFGRTNFGNAVLTANQLIDSGARFVTVNFGDWDSHGSPFGSIEDLKERKIWKLEKNASNSSGANTYYDTGKRKIGLATEFDLGFAAAIKVLSKKAIVVVATEFGRESKINKTDFGLGREHGPGKFSIIVAGPNISSGVSDRRIKAERLGEAFLNLSGHASFASFNGFQTGERALTEDLTVL